MEPERTTNDSKLIEYVNIIDTNLKSIKEDIQKLRKNVEELKTAINEIGKEYNNIVGDIHR